VLIVCGTVLPFSACTCHANCVLPPAASVEEVAWYTNGLSLHIAAWSMVRSLGVGLTLTVNKAGKPVQPAADEVGVTVKTIVPTVVLPVLDNTSLITFVDPEEAAAVTRLLSETTQLKLLATEVTGTSWILELNLLHIALEKPVVFGSGFTVTGTRLSGPTQPSADVAITE